MATNERVPVNDDPVPTPELTPTASAVSTFYRTDAGNQAEQLAGALSQVAPELSQFAETRINSTIEKAQTAARAATEADPTALDYATAVKKGKISSSMNPFFRTAARAQFGRNAAEQYGQAFRNDKDVIYALQNSTNVADFNKVEQQYRQQWMKDNLDQSHTGDLPFSAQFNKLTEAIVKDERSAFVGQANARLIQQTTEGHTQEVASIIRGGREAGHTDDQIIEDINASNDRALQGGMNPRMANLAASTALVNAAMDKLDPRIFDLAKNIKAGSGSLYDTAYMAKDRAEATDKIIVLKARQDTQAREDDTFQRNERVRQGESDIIDKALAGNVKPQDLSAAISTLAKDDPSRAANLGQLVETVQKGRFDKTDQQALAHLTVNVWGGAEPGDAEYVDTPRLIAARNSGALSTEDFTHLREQVQQRDKEEREGGKKGILADSQYKYGLTQVGKIIGGDGLLADPEHTSRAEGAQAEYIHNWLDFVKTQPPPDNDAKNTFIQKQIEQLRTKWMPNRDQNKVGKLPDVNLTGQREEWKVTRVLTLPAVNAIAARLKDNMKLSPESIRQLREQGIPADSVHAFIAAQQTLYQQP